MALATWGADILAECAPLAAALEQAGRCAPHALGSLPLASTGHLELEV